MPGWPGGCGSRELSVAWFVVKEWIWELFWLTAWITCSKLGEGGNTRGSRAMNC